MSSHDTETVDYGKMKRWTIIAIIVILTFLVSYQVATASSSGNGGAAQNGYATQTGSGAQPASSPGGSGGDAAGGCACCENSGTGEVVEGAATADADGIQRIAVDASSGYDPNVIVLQAGMPAEITFSEGFGCMAEVMSRDLGFFEDLQSGPKTIALDPLEPGTYGFSCGMEMVFGQIVVQ
jgi:hypothetical protein